MWESLPIQRKVAAPDTRYSMINRDHSYRLQPDVSVAEWKDVPEQLRAWCMSIWEDEFKLRRCPASPGDILAWIPRKGMILAKYGRWIGPSQSVRCIYVCYNVVMRDYRGEGISGKLILTMCHACTEKWGPIPFMFELEHVPASLSRVPPFLSFSYVWVPFLNIQIPPKWKPSSHDSLATYQGFHTADWTGYQCFEYSGMKIVLDPHNDIIYYDDYASLLTFDALPIPGAYCRVFSPFGTISVLVENLHFAPNPAFKHFLII